MFNDLRKANEKYLNTRVENTKLKEEIQALKMSIEDKDKQIRS